MGFSTNVIAPGAYSDVSTSADYNLGQLSICDDGKMYRYVQFADSVAVVAGSVVCYDGSASNVVTPDVSADGNSDLCAGVAVAAVALNTTTPQYGWIQVSGYCSNIQTDTNVAAGDFLISGTGDGVAHTMSAGEEHKVFAVADAEDSGSTGSGWLRGIL
jgi:hypothetical protein